MLADTPDFRPAVEPETLGRHRTAYSLSFQLADDSGRIHRCLHCHPIRTDGPSAGYRPSRIGVDS